MPSLTYDALNQQLIQLFQNQRYAEALDLIVQDGPSFPADRPLVDYWQMCAAARLGKRQLVVQIAERCLADGLWYGPTLWRQSPSFQALQGDPDFERLVAASQTAAAREAPTEPVRLMYRPDNHPGAPPLLVALHGNQRAAAHTLPFWQAAVGQGWALALPQSTQAMFKGAYIWDDLPVAFAEVQAHCAQLQTAFSSDPGRMVLAGHSMGGLVAIHLAVSGLVPVRGFVANGPAVPFLETPEELEALLPAARNRRLRGYFIVGAKDDDVLGDKIQALAETLQTAGVACQVETVPEATHAYSPDYDAALLRALAFIEAEPRAQAEA